MSRYGTAIIANNDSEFYSELFEKRGLKSIEQMQTFILHNPSVLERIGTTTDTHVWKYGDRYYNLANKYYNDPTLWWIIAWYNGYPTEATVQIGDVLEIPLNLEEIVEVLRV
tara:strand:+ start:146 stop:481 length:336 start_codon:yes stop_codon:yes gene_type:complete